MVNLRPFTLITCLAITVCAFPTLSEAAEKRAEKRGLYVSSYHKGYEWQDGIERAVKSVLQGKCELKQFDMDTKRNRAKAFAQKRDLEAKELMERGAGEALEEESRLKASDEGVIRCA